MPAANIIELRQLLAERFPGLRTRADELSTAKHTFWPTGVLQLDASLRGGMNKGALTEIVAEQRGRFVAVDNLARHHGSAIMSMACTGHCSMQAAQPVHLS